MEGAFGVLRWTPDVFWKSTLTEYFAAVSGFNKKHGNGSKGDAPSDDELAALVAKYG